MTLTWSLVNGHWQADCLTSPSEVPIAISVAGALSGMSLLLILMAYLLYRFSSQISYRHRQVLKSLAKLGGPPGRNL